MRARSESFISLSTSSYVSTAMSSTAGRAVQVFVRTVFQHRVVHKIRHKQRLIRRGTAAIHRPPAPAKAQGWPSFAAAFFSSSPGITRPAGTRHASPPPSTSCEKASLYHTMLPPDTTTTGSARLAKVDCAFSPLPCKALPCACAGHSHSRTAKAPSPPAQAPLPAAAWALQPPACPPARRTPRPASGMVRSTVQMRFFNASPAPHTGGGPSHSRMMGRIMGLRLVRRYK